MSVDYPSHPVLLVDGRYLAILSWYWLVFYKLQSKVFVLLPPDDDLIFTAFKAMIYVCWICQCVRVRSV
jgi:hypothetical protein